MRLVRPEGRLGRSLYATERELAPHVDTEWASTVLLELRVRGVDGARIGEVLAEVDSHCVDSGQDARTVFGEPLAYARSLDLPTAPPAPPRELVAVAATGALQVLGMLAVLWGLQGRLGDHQLDVTSGMLAMVTVLLATVALVTRRVDGVLRAVVHHPVVVWLLTMAHVAALVLLLAVLDDVVLVLDAGWTMAVGAAALAAGTVGQMVTLGPDAEDPVVAPLPLSTAAARTSRAAGLAVRLTPWLLPVATVLLMVPAWLIHR